MPRTASEYTADAGRVLLTPQQRERLVRLADQSGILLSVYIRMVLLEHLEREDPQPDNPEDVDN